MVVMIRNNILDGLFFLVTMVSIKQMLEYIHISLDIIIIII